jgi:hypothetical protein
VNKDSPRSQNATRLQNVSGSRLKLIHTTTWLPPAIREEIERIADCEKLPVSQVCAIGLGQWVRQRLHDQHEETLYPVLRQLIRDELRAFGSRPSFSVALDRNRDPMLGRIASAQSTKPEVDPQQPVRACYRLRRSLFVEYRCEPSGQSRRRSGSQAHRERDASQ